MLAPKPSHTTSDASDPVPQSTMPLLAQAIVAVLRPRPKTAMKTRIAKVLNVKTTTKTKIAKVQNAQMTTTTTKKYQRAPPP